MSEIELWQKHCQLVGDSIDELQYFADREVILQHDFIKAVSEYSAENKKLLDVLHEIDDELIHFEDVLHGMEGNRITALRKFIALKTK